MTTLVDDAHHTPEITSQIQHAARFAHRQFQLLVGEKYAVRWIDMYLVGEEPQGQPWDFAITPELYPLKQFKTGENPFPTKYASSFPTLMIEPGIYLPRMLEDFLVRGGRLEVKDFADQAEILRLKEPLIMNCSGLGAKTLFDDKELTAVKGQLTFLLPQPEVKYAYIDGQRFAYMFPRADGILLGGSHEFGEYSLDPDKQIADRILNEHRRMSAGMKV